MKILWRLFTNHLIVLIEFLGRHTDIHNFDPHRAINKRTIRTDSDIGRTHLDTFGQHLGILSVSSFLSFSAFPSPYCFFPLSMTDQHENPAPSSCSASSVEKGSAPAEPAVSPDPSTWRLFVSKANPPASLWIVFWKGFFFYWGASQGPISVEVKHRLFREEQLPSAQTARYEELRQIFLFDRGFAALPEQFDCFLSVLELEGIGSKAPDGIAFFFWSWVVSFFSSLVPPPTFCSPVRSRIPMSIHCFSYCGITFFSAGTFHHVGWVFPGYDKQKQPNHW